MLLEELKSVSDLKQYHVNVVKGKTIAPWYPTPDEEYWWMKGPRWELLVQMNELGFLTNNCEEGPAEAKDLLYPETWIEEGVLYNTNTVLMGLIKREYLLEFKAYMLKHAIFVFENKVVPRETPEINWARKLPVKVVTNKRGVTEIEAGLWVFKDGKTPNWNDEYYKEHLTPSMYRVVNETYIEVTLYDTMTNRMVHSETGLFTLVTKFMKTKVCSCCKKQLR
jgi:hypothetical protein